MSIVMMFGALPTETTVLFLIFTYVNGSKVSAYIGGSTNYDEYTFQIDNVKNCRVQGMDIIAAD